MYNNQQPQNSGNQGRSGGGFQMPNIGGAGGSQPGGRSIIQWVILAVVGLIIICGGLSFIRNLGSGSGTTTTPGTVPTTPPLSVNLTPDTGGGSGSVVNTPTTGTTGSSGGTGNTGSGPQLGQVVTATGIGNKNAPVGITTSFPTSSKVIYAVVEGVSIPSGSVFFARWSRGGQPFEDSPEITANQAYTNTYIEFHLQPQTSGALTAGSYSVQIFVNGNPGPSIQFTVQ